jgi:hypothetical protein
MTDKNGTLLEIGDIVYDDSYAPNDYDYDIIIAMYSETSEIELRQLGGAWTGVYPENVVTRASDEKAMLLKFEWA